MIIKVTIFSLMAFTALAGDFFSGHKLVGKNFDLNVTDIGDYSVAFQNNGAGTYKLNGDSTPLSWEIQGKELTINFGANVVSGKPTAINDISELTLKPHGKKSGCYIFNAEVNKTSKVNIAGKKFYKPEYFKATMCESK